jgi:hypothetical protein
MNKNGSNGNKCSLKPGKRWAKTTQNHLKDTHFTKIIEK